MNPIQQEYNDLIDDLHTRPGVVVTSEAEMAIWKFIAKHLGLKPRKEQEYKN